MDLLTQLNDQQREACETVNGPVLILAGAGSGKTRTLTYRIAHLIQHHHVPPQKILAFTFTNKAAREMRQRIEQLVGDLAGAMWVGTFHSVAVRILRHEIGRLGYDPHFLIYDSDDSKALMRDILKELGWDEKQWPAQLVLSAISRAKNAFVSPEQWEDHSFYGRRIAEAYQKYQSRLKALNALDFDDLIFYSVYLLETESEVLAEYQQRFQYVLVDEYQDTNLAQFRFIHALAGGSNNLCAVGDDDQSIYGWRGADVRHMLDFSRHYPDAKIIRLEENYRSSGIILKAANALVQNNQGRLGKSLWTQKGDGEKIRVIQAVDENSEAWFATQIVQDAIQRGMSSGDCAILYRTNAQSRAFEMALARAGIPYRLVGGRRFYDRREVKDLLAYLKVLYNPLDALSLLRVINVPRRGLGDVALARLTQQADSQGVSLYRVLDSAIDVPGLSRAAAKASAELYHKFEAWRSFSGRLSDLVRMVVEESGLMAFYNADGGREAEERVENLGELISEAKRFEEEQGTEDLGEFLGWVALVSDWEKTDERSGGVWLMTLHSAKGLEFPLVVVAGLEEGVFPHLRSLEENGLEEERRLFYVGVTRAETELYLSWSKSRTLQGFTQNHVPSRFLTEIPEELMAVAGNVPDVSPVRLGQAVSATDFLNGERVHHPRFGWGTVVSQRGQGENREITVAYPGGGIRSFIVKYAHLHKEENAGAAGS